MYGYQSNIIWGSYYGFVEILLLLIVTRFALKANRFVPNLQDVNGNEIHKNAFPAQMIHSGIWTTPVNWALGIIPDSTSNVYLTNNITASANGLIECSNLIIEDGRLKSLFLLIIG